MPVTQFQLQAVISAGMLTLFGLLAVFNGYSAVRLHLMHRWVPSWVPLIGGIAGAVGIAVMPVRGSIWWSWLPLVLDWGSLPGLTHTAWFYLIRLPRLERQSRRQTKKLLQQRFQHATPIASPPVETEENVEGKATP
ncbi:MAG: hypothetical protein ACLFVU_14500 [Phycisphaerae bacterium]